MALATKYNAKEVEDKWYQFWLDQGFFNSEVNDKPAYTIVIPPPNVTGILHMGHMLNNTIQDVLIRRARLQGFNACWVPGTDHASIATEAKVVAKLKAEGIDKSSISRDEFLKHAWDWTHNYGGKILDQLKKLGASCDWNRVKFTMDEDLYTSVIHSFVDLYEKGKIYRGHRMVNWDPEAKTTLSDEEIIYQEKNGNLYYINYPIEGSEECLTIATTRPETIFGDTAICIHPEDERYQHLKGKHAVVPVVGRKIPIIQDEYVDLEFGTGCLKVTPAHDENDKNLGDKHQLEVIDIFNEDASLNAFGLHYQGQDRFEARKAFANELKEKGFLVKTENHLNKVGTSERTGAVIEPRLSDQWFLTMQDLAQPAIDAVLKDETIKLFPKKFENTYKHWMENIRDWNISRQLWWGHRIPAWYIGEGKNEFVVAKNEEEALAKAIEKTGNSSLSLAELHQEEDVLDTWFSSWLWPMSVFNGINEPENEEFKYYYPTKDLVTGPDILFFWVARMIMAGYEYTEQKPFENVYLTGLVRDKQGRKMSKSLGNSPDALQLIEDFGADGVRVGLLLSNAAGNDLLFDEALCQQGKGFANKIWNAFRLIKGWEVDENLSTPSYAKAGLDWYASRFQQVLEEVDDHFSKYRISDALMASYKLVWDDFCSWLLEIIKPNYGEKIDAITLQQVISLFEDNLKLLHPFMPFVTEEIWQHIAERNQEEALVVNQWPVKKSYQKAKTKTFDFMKEVVSGIRNVRKEKNISFKDSIDLFVINNENQTKELDDLIKKLGNITKLTYSDTSVEGALSYRVGANEYFIPLKGAINIEEEIEKINEEIKYLKGFLNSVEKKLGNERFVNNAPEQVVALEKKKKSDALAKLKTLEISLKSLA
ncbi:valine--tRNA ligase [Psychroflexus maritimus]|uniref:Valine--tRNA ligase n=1 Tax=Psychroflexus maritimus TaxID=2714865 RepID=A0A967DXS9_9FLAO|nr:valine--tRNA ligase [Psychroflexus maritimus]NGZ89030.1 valine--tRNA ligase [Psychroflexus maritimus]